MIYITAVILAGQTAVWFYAAASDPDRWVVFGLLSAINFLGFAGLVWHEATRAARHRWEEQKP